MKPAVFLVLMTTISFGLASTGKGTSPNSKQVFDRSSQALRDGDYAAAERGFQQVLRSDPKNIGALGNLGVVYSRIRRYWRATQAAHEADRRVRDARVAGTR
ncbi:MAG TPA: tetratricopeptide repeat protein [Terriglobales bacterium]|nr:tetratricopeptide repeat protein [Terriglobales bacterium]